MFSKVPPYHCPAVTRGSPNATPTSIPPLWLLLRADPPPPDPHPGVTHRISLAPLGRDSCQKGWRLLYILAAYYKCSEVLRPFVLAFLQGASSHPDLPFQGIAKACEQNLRKTLQFGGRSLFPSSMELRAMVAGRSAKRQLFLLPGGIERHLKIKTCSVALDVIEELCCEMGLQHPEAFDEYILFVVTDRGCQC
uniref:MyTH4 domain-containing protein n=1 Tax=Athene cunicularia TaxID=194338 RepID=A0A663NA65_ATHCN